MEGFQVTIGGEGLKNEDAELLGAVWGYFFFQNRAIWVLYVLRNFSRKLGFCLVSFNYSLEKEYKHFHSLVTHYDHITLFQITQLSCSKF